MRGRMLTLFPGDVRLTAHAEGLLVGARAAGRRAGFLLVCRGGGGAGWDCPRGLQPKGYRDLGAFAFGESGRRVKVPSSPSTRLQAALPCVASCEFVPEQYYFNVVVTM